MPEKEIKNTAELTDMVNNYQSGNSEQNDIASKILFQLENLDSIPFSADDSEEEFIPLNDLISGKVNVPGISSRNQFLEAAQAGFGSSRLDKRFGYQEGKDLEDLRAREQSFANKILSGLGKGAVTTMTTAANSTVGLVAGAGSMLFEGIRQAFDPTKEFNLGQIVDAGTNNIVSKRLIDIQNTMEEVMPNYRTEEERTQQYQDEWYKHMLTGNFIGDSFLKNFGFTLGSMGAGMVTSKMLGKLFARKLSADLMRGVVASSAGDSVAKNELVQMANAIRSNGGVTGLDVERLMRNAQSAGRTIRNANIATQLTGATIAAIGEGTIEGLMAQSEFLQDFIPKMQQQYGEMLQNLDSELQMEHPEWYQLQMTYNDYGLPEGKNVLVSEEGKRVLAERQAKLQEQYDATMKYVEEQGKQLATTTCALNLPILMASDLFQFGKAFGRGWQTARRNLPSVRGGITYGIDGTPKADFSSLGGQNLRALGNTAKVALTEANEEMLQGYISAGAKEVADRHLTYFADSGYDPEALASCADWFSDMFRGGNEYISKSASWQEGAIGAFTGLLGIPSRHLRTWHGGLPEAIRSTRANEMASREAANRLNSVVNSEEFQNRWRGYIRHLKFDNEKGKAAEEDNQYAWHNADMKALINDVVTFADAGRLEELNTWVDHVSSLGKQDIDEIREFMKSNTEVQSAFDDNTPDQEIIDKVHAKADEIRNTIKNYREVYNNLSSVANENLSSDKMRELIFTGMELKGFEERFHRLLDETMTVIDPILQLSATQDGKGGITEDVAEIAQNLKRLQEQYNRAFSGNVTASFFDFYTEAQLNDRLDELESAAEKWDKDNNTKWATSVQDMRKIAADRRELIRKIASLRTMTDAEFDSMKTTSQKVAEAVEENQTKHEVEEFSSVNDVRNALANTKNKSEFFKYKNTLMRQRKKNKFIDEYFNIDEVKKNVNYIGFEVADSAESKDAQLVAKKILQSAIGLADTANELLNFDEKSRLLISEEEATSDVKSRATSQAMPDEYYSNIYQQAIVIARNMLRQAGMMSDEYGTNFRDTAQSTPAQPQSEPQSAPASSMDAAAAFGRGRKKKAQPVAPPQTVPAPNVTIASTGNTANKTVISEEVVSRMSADAKEEIKTFTERVQDWLSEQNLQDADGLTREQIFDKFGNELEAIAYIPVKYLSAFGEDLLDNRIYCGKGYFIDHAVSHHNEVTTDEYKFIQTILNNPDSIRRTGDKSIAFTKQLRKGYAVLLQLNRDGEKVVLHKSFFWNEKGMPYKNKEEIKVNPLVGGRSTISPNEDSLAGRLLSALNGNTANIGNYLIPTNELNDIIDEFEKKGIVDRKETATEKPAPKSKPEPAPEPMPEPEPEEQVQGQSEAASLGSPAPESQHVEVAPEDVIPEGEMAFNEKGARQVTPGGDDSAYPSDEERKMDDDATVALSQFPYNPIQADVDAGEDLPLYYNTAIPECVPVEVRTAIKQIKAIKRNPDAKSTVSTPRNLTEEYNDGRYDTVWNYLFDHGAFDNMANFEVVNAKGKRIYPKVSFAIDPNFVDDKGNTPILIATEDNGEVKILNILRENVEDSTMGWDGLNQLRAEIIREYREKGVSEYKNGKFFVFSKTTTCWAKRPGVITYNAEKMDSRIDSIPGYDEKAPIVVLRKKVDPKTHKVTYYFANISGATTMEQKWAGSEAFRDKLVAINKEDPKKEIVGRIYYLAKNTAGGFTPIRCNIKHFTPEDCMYELESGNAAYKQIYDCASRLADLYNDYHSGNIMESEVEAKTQEVFRDLTKVLDCWDMYFSIGTSKDLGDTLRFSYHVIDKDADGNKFVKETQVSEIRDEYVTPENIMKIIAKRRMPFQLRINWGDEQQEQLNAGERAVAIKEFIDNGLLLSNAVALRERGVDLYFNPWSHREGDFITEIPRASSEQLRAETSLVVGRQNAEEEDKKNTPDIATADSEESDDEIPMDTESQYTEDSAEVVEFAPESEAESDITLPDWKDLTSDNKASLRSLEIVDEESYKKYIEQSGAESIAHKLGC